jgi:hypothetical protein
MSNPVSSIRIEGRIKQRKLKPKPEFADLIADLESKGMRDLIKADWFDTTYEDREWSSNLITSNGLDKIGGDVWSGALARFWDNYQFGTGSGIPTMSSASLSNYYSYCHDPLALPPDYKANTYDYNNGRVTLTRTWLSRVVEDYITVTEGGFGAGQVGSLNSRFLLENPISLEPGDYYAPIYELVITLSPTLSTISIPSPFIAGIGDIAATARFETLFGLLPALRNDASYGSTSTYNHEYNKVITGTEHPFSNLLDDIGEQDEVYFSLFSSSGGESANLNYHDIVCNRFDNTNGYGYWTLAWPMEGENGYDITAPDICVVLATDASPLTFSSEGHIMQGVLEVFNNFPRNRTQGEGSGWRPYESGSYQSIVREVIDNNHGNHSGIRSIAWCIKESPVGSTDWQYRSLYRVLLDKPMNKEPGKILTLDFKRSWA